MLNRLKNLFIYIEFFLKNYSEKKTNLIKIIIIIIINNAK